jgi:hypothetical protein
MQSLDTLKPNNRFVTIENESLIASVVTNQVHPSRLFSRNCFVPSVVDAFQSLNSVHLLLVVKSGIVLATGHSVVKSDMCRVHGCAEKRYLVLVSRTVGAAARKVLLLPILYTRLARLGKANCEGKLAEGRSWEMQRLLAPNSDHPRWA